MRFPNWGALGFLERRPLYRDPSPPHTSVRTLVTFAKFSLGEISLSLSPLLSRIFTRHSSPHLFLLRDTSPRSSAFSRCSLSSKRPRTSFVSFSFPPSFPRYAAFPFYLSSCETHSPDVVRHFGAFSSLSTRLTSPLIAWRSPRTTIRVSRLPSRPFTVSR